MMLVFDWRKSSPSTFDVYAWKKIITLILRSQWPLPLTIRLQICSPTYAVTLICPALCFSLILEVSVDFTFWENRIERTDGRGATIMRLPGPGEGRNKVVQLSVVTDCWILVMEMIYDLFILPYRYFVSYIRWVYTCCHNCNFHEFNLVPLRYE